MLEPGTIVADKYRVERVIGRGGMGTVIEATHVHLASLFALKFLHNVSSSSMTERFFREARATAALRSEHVCRVFDVGMFEGTPYLVMERLEGTDLARVLRRQTRLPVHEVCDYVIQACIGIAEAHAAQIVHRDLKPGNLFLTARPDGAPLVKVLDFGVAKAPQDDTDFELTATHTILGSPSYMSLEQLRSSKLVDRRSDLWSLGVIVFELVSGRRPFVGDGVADLALKIAMEPVPRLPDGPAGLDDIIGRCLMRDPAQRYQDVAELATALGPFASEAGRRLIGSIVRAVRASAPDSVSMINSGGGDVAVAQPSIYEGTSMHSAGAIENSRALPARAPRVRAGLVAVIGLAILTGTSIGVAVTRTDDAEPAAAAPAPESIPMQVAAPADAAPDAAPDAVSTPAIVAAPPVDAAIVAEPVPEPVAKQPVAKRKPQPAKPKQGTKTPATQTTEDLSKSRL